MGNAAIILQEALALPEKQRLRIAVQLVESLESFDDPEAVEAAWKDEIDRRVADLDAGRCQAIPGHQAIARVRQRLRGARRG